MAFRAEREMEFNFVIMVGVGIGVWVESGSWLYGICTLGALIVLHPGEYKA